MDEKLSIIDIKWARNGKKFVSGTSSKMMYVVHWIDEPVVKGVNWTSKTIKAKFDSSIVSCAFDPSGRVVAAVSFDGNCKIISAYLPKIDTEPTTGPFASITDFGTPLLSFNCMFWLNHVTWNPSGNEICYISHDGTL